MKHTTQPVRGFSLIELIVSLGIFSLVILTVAGAYITLINIDQRTRASNQLSSSLAFAVESVARSIRTGTDYACDGGGNCPSGGSSVSFVDSQGQPVTYLLRSDGTLGQCIGSGGCTSALAVPLTDPRINIQALRFYVRGVGTSDQEQPRVTLSLAGTMTTDEGDVTTFSIQTGATQRIIDL